MKQLKEYQEKAVDDLINYTKKTLTKSKSSNIILEAPTGAGKTFIATKYIEQIVNDINIDVCFLWISIGKGGLHEQSMKKIKKEINEEFECNLLEQTYFGSKQYINQNEIVFISWQKIKLKDNTTGNWKALVMKEKETTNFIEVLNNTRLKNRKIILIIDESHAGAKTEKSLEVIDNIIKPDITIEMSATPIINQSDYKITVDPNEVIEAGIIKKEIIINKDIDKIPHNEIDSQKLILYAAIEKQKQLKKLYKQEKSNVNPLVLIQLPNSEIGTNLKKEIIELLKEQNITEDNNKLAIWLNEEKINNDSELLFKNNSKVEYLIFKQAIDTGWDCPRAQILIKFRETKSIIFEIQTVGRILRMPEAKHYNNDELNTAYVYTNINNIIVKKETYNPNIIKSCKSIIKRDYKPIYLLSYYKQKEEHSVIPSIFTPIFCHTFSRFFMIDETKKRQNYQENTKKIEEAGINNDFNSMDYLYKDINISTSNIDKKINNIKNNNTINTTMSNIDLQSNFNKLIKDNLNGFTPRKSIFQIKSAILYTMKKYLNLSPNKNGIIYIEKLVVKNKEIFSKIIDEAIKDYKKIYNNNLSSNEKWIENWQIEDTRNYNPNNNTEVSSKLSLHNPLYIELESNDRVNKDELDFIKYLDKQTKIIDWFWLNGQDHLQKNFAIKTSNNKSFQPNFLIRFKDGRIGIFDIKKTKSIDNKTKAKALFDYIKNQKENIIGGLIYKDNNTFKIFNKEKYVDFNKEPNLWEDFADIIKK